MKKVMWGMVGMAMWAAVLVTGCATQPKPDWTVGMCVTYASVTADQKFVLNGDKYSVEEFFDKIEYDKRSKNVILIVDHKSLVTEETVVKAINLLKSREYVVSLAPGSKYPHLAKVCEAK